MVLRLVRILFDSYFNVSTLKVREICEVIASGIQPLQNLSVLQKIGDGKMEWGHFYINNGFTGKWTLAYQSGSRYVWLILTSDTVQSAQKV